MADDASDKSGKDTATVEAAKAKGNVGMWIGAGVGAGIGSAAVAAALLYATRHAKKKNTTKG